MNDDDVLYDARGDVARGDVALDDVACDDIAHDMLPVILLPVIVSVECWPLDAFATMMKREASGAFTVSSRNRTPRPLARVLRAFVRKLPTSLISGVSSRWSPLFID